MMKSRNLWAAGVLIGCLAGMAGMLSAQTKQAPATLDDLLTELRGLRADLTQSSSATTRTQLLVARMQIQEQRIDAVTRQIAEVRNQLSGIRQRTTLMESSLKGAEDGLAQAAGDERRQQEAVLADIKRNFGAEHAQLQQQMQDLTARESELLNQFSTEQIRWNDFNERLDALERALQPTTR